MADGYASVCSVGSEEINQLPLNADDGTLPLETLKAVYPRATGLFFMDGETKRKSRTSKRTSSTIRRVIMLKNGNLFPPSGGWGNSVYNVLCSDGDSSLPPSPEKTEEQPTKKPKIDERAYAPKGTKNSKTLRLRKQGNDSYRSSFEDEGQDMRERHLKTACNLYSQSVLWAKFIDQECAALKNLGKAGWRLASTYLESEPPKDPSEVSAVFSKAIGALTKALQLGTEIQKPNEWLVDVDSSIERCIEKVKEFLIDSVNVFGDRCRYLELIINNCHSPVWKGRLYVELARTHFKSAIVSMTEGQQQDGFVFALDQFGKCHFPIEEAKRLLQAELDLKELETDVFANMSAAQARQEIYSGDALLKKVLKDLEELNMDGIYIVMDKYRQAVVLSRENQIEYEAIAHSRLGKLYSDVLKMKKRAKEYFTQCIQLANTLSPRNFAGQAWFKEAKGALFEIQNVEKRREGEKWRKEREPYLKQLKEELEALQEFQDDEMEVTDLIKNLPTKFPAKHRKKSEMLNFKEDEDLTKMDKKEINKLIQKLILLYHPDHVDKEKYGFKYYVLCEEITKVLTAKYEHCKDD